MTSGNITLYKKLLNLHEDTEFVHITHEDAIVATVYKIIQPPNLQYVLKISESPYDYWREKYFLQYFSKILPVPNIIKTIQPKNDIHGAILMEYLPGDLLKIDELSNQSAYKIGAILAQIHTNNTEGFGDLTKPDQLTQDPRVYFSKKFNENINECKDHLPTSLIKKCRAYHQSTLDLLTSTDGPCIIHRDFRPGNIIYFNGSLQGIIDWASARASFAEDDFCPMEHGEWLKFNPYKKSFLAGYASVRQVPHYKEVMPLLRLNRALAIIGFTVQNSTWNGANTKLYQFNYKFLNNLFC